MKNNKQKIKYTCLAVSAVLSTGLYAEEPVYVEIGSRGAPKTITETASPIDVIERWEIEQTGVTETGRLIQRLVASFNFPTSTVSDASDAVRPATLRGMGPDQILVLVNGKRIHNTALVHVNGSVGRGSAGIDFNTIPLVSIERIEILRDGAAAQYGSDAIAGVINIILRSNTNKSSIQVTAGQTFEGDGAQFVIAANTGFDVGEEGGFVNLSVEKRDRNATNRTGLDPRQQYATLADGSPDPREASFDRNNHRYGDPESNNYSVYLNGALPIGENEVYIAGGYTQRKAISGGFYRRSLDDRNTLAIYPSGFLPMMNTTTKDYNFLLGYKVSLNDDWSLDTSIITGRNSLNYDISNSLNVSLGLLSPTSVDAGTLHFEQTTINSDLTGSFDVGLNAPIYLAVGAEYRRDGYEIEAGEFASYANGIDDNPATASLAQSGKPSAPGIQLFPGFRPSNEVDVNRHNIALYIELENNITDKLLVGLAGRYERYSDVGSNATGKISIRYQVADSIALRGSFSTGFRAPSLQQANFNTINTQFIDDGAGGFTGVEVGTFQNNSAVAKALGVPTLDNETSINATFGLVFTPTEHFTLATDLYRIEIKDRIVLSGIFRPEASGGIIATALSPFGIGGAQFFSNAIDTVTEGIDIVSSYQNDFMGGYLNLSAATHYNRTKIDGEITSPSGLDSGTLYNRIEQVRLEKGQPRQHYVLSANYDWRQFSLTARANRYGSITNAESASNPSRDQTFAANWIFDLMFTYRPTNQFTLSLGADNLFDSTPDRNKTGEDFNGIFTYNRRSAPFGYNGGFYYARLKYDF